jgi:peptidoglycan-associated lipoprotein
MDEERRDCMRIGLAAHAVAVTLLMIGCAKQPATSTVSSAPPPTAPGKMDSPGGNPGSSAQPVTSNPNRSASSMGSTGSGTRVDTTQYVPVAELTDIHFDFDKYEIRTTDAAVLDRHAAWLKQNGDRLILIEGHTDERGTSEYNVALGERRAKATMNYLVSHGVAAGRIAIVSFGEERPMCSQHDESCWAQNRRAHFLAKRG